MLSEQPSGQKQKQENLKAQVRNSIKEGTHETITHVTKTS